MTGFAWPQGFTAPRLAAATSALLVVAIAWTLAKATWQFWPGADGRVGEPASAPLAGPVATQPGFRLQTVADLSLFGSAQAVSASGSVDAPQTQLNLTLRGVWASPSRLWARAIVASGSVEENYKIGDALPGGAVLEQVLPDRVILKRSGRLEALYLPKESMGGMDAVPAVAGRGASYEASGPATVDMSGGVGAKLQDYRQRILNDPQQAFSLVRMQPVMDGGKLKGYKLSPNKEKQLFREVGLRPGDVVTSVNGLAISDPAALGQIMSQVSSASQLTLTVDRGGREETIIVPIGN